MAGTAQHLWNVSFALRIPAIDTHLRELFDLTYELDCSIRDGTDEEEVGSIVERLKEHCQEHFGTQVEGRLMAMLEGFDDLSLALLNRSTQAWVEMEYHRRRHGETGQTPIERFVAGPDLTRPVPALDDLVRAFTASTQRVQRQSDGTLSLQAVRYEVPNRYRHLRRLQVSYTSWDRSTAYLVDAHTDQILCRLYPVDLAANAGGQRRVNESVETMPPPSPSGEMASLLTHLLAEYAATGLPAAYLPAEGEKDNP